ncbi:uncharacterized protein LOC115236977 [Formica exsecta]|uniref:uncharacterized protein LOC115236977 n=1 Tax=Formica exsecta TaxID=72781 RepID=UPI001143DB8B|nr:uncharacterized protein LOC115236977 [Formica exsecta]
MASTIDKTLNPFCLVFCFLGSGIFRDSLGHTRFRFSIFYILTVWSVYACAFYCVKFFRCIKNLSLVDDTLEQLGTPKEYCKMRNSMKWIMIIWFMTICITWISDYFWDMEKFQDTRVIIIPAIINYPFHLNTFMCIMFIFLLRYIGTRFDKINNYIEQLSETEECGLRCTWKKSLVTRYYVRSAKNREHVLWTAMHLHLELCGIARKINDFFGMQMTLQMISYFVLLTGVFYYQYRMILCHNHNYKDSGESQLIFLIHADIWTSIYLIKFVTLNYICENVSTKAGKIKDVIHKLTNLVYFNQSREDIFQFVLQISLHPLKFNGMSLFNFGYEFIGKFFIGILSLMIFMVQMDTSPLSRILISNGNNASCYA